MENTTGTTIVYSGYIGIMENELEIYPNSLEPTFLKQSPGSWSSSTCKSEEFFLSSKGAKGPRFRVYRGCFLNVTLKFVLSIVLRIG